MTTYNRNLKKISDAVSYLKKENKEITHKDVIKLSGLSHYTVRKYLKELNIIIYNKNIKKISDIVSYLKKKNQAITLRDVVNLSGLSHCTVRKFLKELNVKTVLPIKLHNPFQKKQEEINEKNLKKTLDAVLYLKKKNQAITLKDVIELSGLTLRTVKKYLKELEVNTVRFIRLNENFSKRNEERTKKILKAIEDVKKENKYITTKMIQERTGLHYSFVSDILKKLNIDIKQSLKENKKEKLDKVKNTVNRLKQIGEQINARKIHQLTGINLTTLYKYLKELKIELNTEYKIPKKQKSKKIIKKKTRERIVKNYKDINKGVMGFKKPKFSYDSETYIEIIKERQKLNIQRTRRIRDYEGEKESRREEIREAEKSFSKTIKTQQ